MHALHMAFVCLDHGACTKVEATGPTLPTVTGIYSSFDIFTILA